jgi:hypothetical protein
MSMLRRIETYETIPTRQRVPDLVATQQLSQLKDAEGWRVSQVECGLRLGLSTTNRAARCTQVKLSRRKTALSEQSRAARTDLIAQGLTGEEVVAVTQILFEDRYS